MGSLQHTALRTAVRAILAVAILLRVNIPSACCCTLSAAGCASNSADHAKGMVPKPKCGCACSNAENAASGGCSSCCSVPDSCDPKRECNPGFSATCDCETTAAADRPFVSRSASYGFEIPEADDIRGPRAGLTADERSQHDRVRLAPDEGVSHNLRQAILCVWQN